jgi:putative ABC transport system substrate-binding protein
VKKIVNGLLLVAVFLPISRSADAQPSTVARIGYLTPADSPPYQVFLQELRELGYIDRKNIVIEYRSAAGNRERLNDLANELVRLKVDIIVADGAGPTVEAKRATSRIPIVMTSNSDPIGLGLIASLAHPGGNVTGLASLTGELGGKLLEILKEIVPRLDRVAVLRVDGQTNDLFVKDMEKSAGALRVELIPVVVRGTGDLDGAFRNIMKEKVNGLVSRLGPLAPTANKLAVEYTIKHRLPAVSTDRDWVDNGGLIIYAADQNARQRRVAMYVDKILKGAKPADLPVEQPTKFELVINLKAAKQIGVTIPQSVLYKADRVIK